MSKMQKLIFIIPLAILGMVLFVAVGGKIVMDLWNWLLPPLFGWHVITFWQALGILVLCRVLLGGHGWRGCGRSNFRRRMQERFGHMTPEKREQFRQGMRERCAFGPSPAESKGL
jgi:hypothetical protein